MLGFYVVYGRNQNIGNDKDVRRGLRGNIPESRYQFILIDDILRDFATDNFTENRFFSHDLFLFCLIWREQLLLTHALVECVTQFKSMSEFLLSFQPPPSISFLNVHQLNEE